MDYVYGVMTAAATAPRRLEASEWLPLLYESADTTEPRGETTLFKANAQALLIHDAIVRQLTDWDYQFPVPESERAADSAGIHDWCRGFMRVAADYLDELYDIASYRENGEEMVSHLLAPIAYFATDEKRRRETRTRLVDECENFEQVFLDALPACVTQLWELWIEYGDLEDDPADACDREDGLWNPPEPFVRDEKKVGRNEKCPCGSGRKYKKCCG
jgi:yecA family protein